MATFDLTKFFVFREDFPTLTDAEFRLVILYSLGATLDEISSIEHISKPMVKKKLYLSKCKLDLESIHTFRVLINLKVNAAILDKII